MPERPGGIFEWHFTTSSLINFVRSQLLGARVDAIELREEHWVTAELMAKAGQMRRWVIEVVGTSEERYAKAAEGLIDKPLRFRLQEAFRSRG